MESEGGMLGGSTLIDLALDMLRSSLSGAAFAGMDLPSSSTCKSGELFGRRGMVIKLVKNLIDWQSV